MVAPQVISDSTKSMMLRPIPPGMVHTDEMGLLHRSAAVAHTDQDDQLITHECMHDMMGFS
jgi:hypothetical protein